MRTLVFGAWKPEEAFNNLNDTAKVTVLYTVHTIGIVGPYYDNYEIVCGVEYYQVLDNYFRPEAKNSHKIFSRRM